MNEVENQISILKSLQNKIKDTKEQLEYLRDKKKSQLLMVRDAIQEHLESLPIKEGKDWLGNLYWSDYDFANTSKEAYKKVFGNAFKPPIKMIEIACEECEKIEDVPCKSWHNYKEKTSRNGHSCKSCQSIKHEQNESQRVADKNRGEERQKYMEDLRNLPYTEYLQTEHWQKVRKYALQRAGYSCQLCNEKGPLDVHHRTYERLGWEWDKDVIALCRDCHEKHHDISNE